MVKDEVGITSQKKLWGFRKYLVMESNTLRSDGTRRELYHYHVPRELLDKALAAGGTVQNAGVAGEEK